jgi:basic membrane protein A and related proteins
MKKLVSLFLALILSLGVCAVALAESYEIGMITDIGTIDDKSFNQGTWEAIKAYAEANGKTFNYYQPSAQSTEIYVERIDQAVADGAKVIVTPGFLFEEPIFIAQDKYPDVNFVLIDGNPHNADYSEYRTEKNAVGIVFAEEQSGFLAGYAAVKDGYTKLGFMGGMAVPAVVRYGYGYVQGADYAAKEMGLTDVSINYNYTGGFAATPEAQAMASSWYNDGIQVIFACGGAVGNSVMAAAEAAGGKVIGVDVDQSVESDTVITSAMKGLGAAVEQALTAYYGGKFPGGEAWVLGADKGGVQLPMATSRFAKFTQADYDAIYAKLAKAEVVPQKDVVESPVDLKPEIAKVNLIG